MFLRLCLLSISSIDFVQSFLSLVFENNQHTVFCTALYVVFLKRTCLKIKQIISLRLCNFFHVDNASHDTLPVVSYEIVKVHSYSFYRPTYALKNSKREVCNSVRETQTTPVTALSSLLYSAQISLQNTVLWITSHKKCTPFMSAIQ